MAKKIIVGNWKMNPVSAREAEKIFSGTKRSLIGLTKVESVICPPAVYLAPLKKLAVGSRIVLGAQNIAAIESGAQTGSISSLMVKDLGAKYTIIGHSERRAAGETDQELNEKVKLALKAGLKVIFCVGEKERDEQGRYLGVIKDQLEKGLERVGKQAAGKLLIAYEPVWAIGASATGADTPENFLHNALFVKKVLSGIVGAAEAKATPILYGGSANAKNALDFLAAGQADGLLVGRASLDPKQFSEILKLANSLK